MALFKILKGQEKNLPATKTEGWAYVTTDEGNMYVDVSASKRVRIGSHADKADVATKAEGDTESIRAKYLAKLKQVTSNGTTFTFRGETGDGSDAADLITIPLAGDKAGLISNAAQTIKGNKTFANGISFPTIGTWPTPANETYPIKSQGLSWLGSSDNAAIFYEVQASDKGMLVIESGDDTNAGLEIRNAASKKKVTIIDGRFIGDLTGTADYADKAKGDSTSIRTTYIHKIKQVTSNGTTFTFRGEYGDGSNASDLITIPNASASVAGLITNAAQILGGNKTFTGDIYISHGTTATMTYNTTNPKLVFSENGGQPVGIVYTDYDSYRNPAGLKVMSTVSNNGKAWFEVEGSLYVGGDIYDKQNNILLASKYVAQLVGSQGNTNYTITPQNQNGTNLANILNVPINLVGSANTNSKIFLVGTTSQNATAQTGYSHDTVYIDSDGFLYDSGNKPSYHSRVSIGNTNNYKWHRIARTNEIKNSWHDDTILLYISQDYNGGSYGLLRVSLRTNNISSRPDAYVEGEWIARSGFALSNFKLALYSAANKVYADLYYISPGSYAGITVKQIQQGSRGSLTQNGWFLTNSSEADGTTASDKKASTSYKDITAAQAGLRGGVAYTSVQDTVDDSRVNNANYADRAQYLDSYGNVAPESGRTSSRGGVYTYNMYNETANGAPSTYLSVIGFGCGTGGHVEIAGYWCSNNGLWYRSLRDTTDNWYAWNRIWVAGNSVTSAVWNDYAECRKSDSQEPGYVMFEKGDDSLSKTIERLQHFAGIVSDTWGFSQGETVEAKTNIAVAGRVLAYPYRDRNEYKPGDCVCAAPGGKVDIMTREEVAQYPDRIVGTVSCVPDYEEWGGGEGADRDPVKVNGRIWIKVK